ncbi:MAG: hypothetical protein HYR56_29250 [Acidobacteria bacterium]|nr:hypothetical protein [Acidobacteriota bacterium]MBI3425330.1 hypothetical protein [Acidobacteriota bacterium]
MQIEVPWDAAERAKAEVTLFVVLLLSYIWGWQGAFRGALWVVIGAGVLFIIAANVRRGYDAHALGLRLDNLPRSLLEVGLATLLVSGLVAGSGWLLGTLWPLERLAARALWWRFFWAFVQQYALQAFVFVRMREVYTRDHHAALTAAGVFAFLHVPNPLLTACTFLSGYLWCRLFARCPNLFTLALSHTILALVTSHSFPRAWMHGMKVGPGYFNF